MASSPRTIRTVVFQDEFREDLRFWISRLWDFHLPREASMLKPHDPGHFERVLRQRNTLLAMQALDVGALPVSDGELLVGIITDRDVVLRSVALGEDPAAAMVRDAMTPQVIYCFDDQDVVEVGELMRERQVRRLLVLARGERVVGIVSLGDLAIEAHDDRLCGHALEGISESFPLSPWERVGVRA